MNITENLSIRAYESFNVDILMNLRLSSGFLSNCIVTIHILYSHANLNAI